MDEECERQRLEEYQRRLLEILYEAENGQAAMPRVVQLLDELQLSDYVGNINVSMLDVGVALAHRWSRPNSGSEQQS